MTAAITETRVGHRDMVERVTDLLPGIRARADETEELRHLPQDTIDELTAAGFFRMYVPREFGGFELEAESIYEVGRLLGTACASTAWAATFLTSHALAVARYPIEAQREVYGDRGEVLAAGSFHPLPGAEGRLEEGGIRVTGRWDFCSGIMHADWCFVDVPLAPGQASGTQRYTCLIPVSEVEIHDVWHTTGMRGTGSNDVSVKEVFVPQRRMLPTEVFFASHSPGSEAHPGYAFLHVPFYRVSAIIHAAFVMGAAERFLEVFRTQIAPRRMRPVGAGKLIDSPLTHARYGAAEYSVLTARLLGEYQVRQAHVLYAGEGDLALEDRAFMRLSSVGAIAAAAEAVDSLTRISGGSMFKRGSELDRIKRDISVMVNHNSGDWDFHSETTGRILLGLPAEAAAMVHKAL